MGFVVSDLFKSCQMNESVDFQERAMASSVVDSECSLDMPPYQWYQPSTRLTLEPVLLESSAACTFSE